MYILDGLLTVSTHHLVILGAMNKNSAILPIAIRSLAVGIIAA